MEVLFWKYEKNPNVSVKKYIYTILISTYSLCNARGLAFKTSTRPRTHTYKYSHAHLHIRTHTGSIHHAKSDYFGSEINLFGTKECLCTSLVTNLSELWKCPPFLPHRSYVLLPDSLP